MRRIIALAALGVSVFAACTSYAEDLSKRVRKAVDEATLDQTGTAPFHLKAILTPSFDRDRDSGRSGEVEIWWASPTHWRREVRSAQFHQIEIVDGTVDWQKNEGDLFPEWLRQLANALIRPVPNMDALLERVRSAEVRNILGETDLSWTIRGGDGNVSKTIGSGLRLTSDGRLESAGDLGWSSWREEISDFHGRKVARKLTGAGLGGPEVTAKVVTLEDLQQTSTLFQPIGESAPLLRTVVLNETDARKNLLSGQSEPWPPMPNGPYEGILIAEVQIDSHGKVVDVGTTLSDNPGLIDPARDRMRRMNFKPFTLDGQPVSVITTITMPFKTTRPAGTEDFDSARTYFEHGRNVGFPATRNVPYVLTAQFEARGASGGVATGSYTDTFVSETQWRREAVFENSHFVRTRNGDKYYLQAEGPAAGSLKIILMILEPIPAIDTFVESDWRIQREQWKETSAVRVASGHENLDGSPDPNMFRGYWFDSSGQLVKAFEAGLEIQRSNFKEFNGAQVAQHIDVLKDKQLALQITVTSMSAIQPSDAKPFVLKGHEWERRFTAEVR